MPAWSVTPPNDPEAIDLLARTFTESGYEMREVLRVLFTSDFFKEARFAKIKSPAEVLVGTLRLVGGYKFPGSRASATCPRKPATWARNC